MDRQPSLGHSHLVNLHHLPCFPALSLISLLLLSSMRTGTASLLWYQPLRQDAQQIVVESLTVRWSVVLGRSHLVEAGLSELSIQVVIDVLGGTTA